MNDLPVWTWWLLAGLGIISWGLDRIYKEVKHQRELLQIIVRQQFPDLDD